MFEAEEFKIFGFEHLLTIFLVITFSLLSPFLFKRSSEVLKNNIGLGIAILIILNESIKPFYYPALYPERFFFLSTLPLHLCNLASLFIDLSNKNIDKIIKEKKEKNFGCYHDQEFIEIFHSVLIDQYNIDIIYPYHPRHLGCFPSLYGKQGCSALHFSNRAMQDLKDQNPDYLNLSTDEVRIKHIKKVLGVDL